MERSYMYVVVGQNLANAVVAEIFHWYDWASRNTRVFHLDSSREASYG